MKRGFSRYERWRAFREALREPRRRRGAPRTSCEEGRKKERIGISRAERAEPTSGSGACHRLAHTRSLRRLSPTRARVNTFGVAESTARAETT
ncbi:unnamed protein product [Lampetra planeri]